MKNPKKIQDPTEAALSAIQEALTLDLDESVNAGAVQATERVAGPPPVREPRPVSRRALRPDEERMEPRREPREGPGSGRSRLENGERRAANDDRQGAAQMLGLSQLRTSAAPLWWAGVGSLVWIAIGIALAISYNRVIEAASSGTQSLGSSPALLVILAGLVLPPLGFFAMGALVRRSREMQHIARTMTEVALRLAQPETIATDAVVSVGQAVRREVASMGDGIDRAISRAAELETMVRNEVSALEQAYEANEVRIRNLVGTLQAERRNIEAETERLREGIQNAESLLSSEVKELADRIHGTMLETSERITETLGDKGEHITGALGRVGDSMIDSLTAKGGELIDRLQITGDNIREDLSTSADRLSATLKSRADELNSNLLSTTTEVAALISDWSGDVNSSIDTIRDRITDHLHATSDRITEELSSRVGDLNTVFRESGDAVLRQVSGSGGDFMRRMEETAERVAEVIALRGGDLADRIEVTGNRIYDAVTVRGDTLEQRLTDAGDRISSALDRSALQAAQTLVEKGDEISSSFALAGSDMTERLNVVASEVTKAIGVRGSKVTDAFRETADTLVSTIGTKGDAIKEMLTARLKAMEETITVRGAELADRMHHDGVTLARVMQEGVKAFDTTVKVHAPELVDQISHRVNTVNENLKVAATTLDERLATTTGSISATLDQRIVRIEQTLDQRAQSLTETLASRTLGFARAISEGTRTATESLDKSLETLDGYFGSRTKAIGDMLLERTDGVSRSIGARAQEIVAVLDGRVSRIEELVNGRLESVATSIEVRGVAVAEALAGKVESVSSQLKADATDVERTLTQMAQNVSESLTSRAEQVSESLGTRLGEIANLIDDKNSTFLTTLERTSQRAVAEITTTNTALKTDVHAIIERLGDANSTFQTAMSAAVDNLNHFETRFADQVGAFEQSVGSISHAADVTAGRLDAQIQSLKGLSTGALSEIAAVTERFDQQSRLVYDAAQTLSDTHERIDSVLDARRTAIEDLSTTLSQRIDDLEGRLQTFHAVLDETFTEAQNQARQVTSVVTESASATLRNIETQYEMVRASADTERTRTAETLRSTYENALADVNRMFSDTGRRFAEVAEELKRSAGSVQQSVEMAREEMKRGILQLPAETEASAATMRRAVSEQIKALAELNEIVARQGQAFDVVESSAREAVRELARESVSREMAPPRPRVDFSAAVAAALAPTEPAPRPAEPARSEPARTEPAEPARRPAAARRSEAGERPATVPARPSSRPQAPAPAPRDAAAAPAADGGRESWLSELLARASGDFESEARAVGSRPAPQPRSARERPVQHTLESLESLSIDITRMIDDRAASDLWERYQRGERNVFTRKLYTLQGQQTFDELKRKYRSNAEFRDTVDRYLAEFDHLLDQVGSDDRGNALTQSYLTSDTGKVYTMLAHAAGRFD